MAEHPTDEDCIFCAIVAGDIPARTVYENEEVLAFLDANPLAPGHTLVVPKGHYETIDHAPESIRQAVMDRVAALVPGVESAVDADGSNIGVNNGPSAGQEIPHLHAHIVPRFEGDGGRPIHAVAGSPPDLSESELDDIGDRIQDGVGG